MRGEKEEGEITHPSYTQVESGPKERKREKERAHTTCCGYVSYRGYSETINQKMAAREKYDAEPFLSVGPEAL